MHDNRRNAKDGYFKEWLKLAPIGFLTTMDVNGYWFLALVLVIGLSTCSSKYLLLHSEKKSKFWKHIRLSKVSEYRFVGELSYYRSQSSDFVFQTSVKLQAVYILTAYE